MEVLLNLDLTAISSESCGFLKLHQNLEEFPIVTFRSDNCHERTRSTIYYARFN
jgi:hypothetical protein